MQKPLKNIIKFLYGPFISIIYFFMRHYRDNRERLNHFLSNKKISSFLQFAAVVILIIWLLIFAFSSPESRRALTEQVKQSFSQLRSGD